MLNFTVCDPSKKVKDILFDFTFKFFIDYPSHSIKLFYEKNLSKGNCVAKQTYLANCATYGVASCQEWLGLTCAIGPGNYLQW